MTPGAVYVDSSAVVKLIFDEDETRDAACIINGRTVDVVDKAPVTYLAKTTVHTRQMADYDIVIDSGKTATGLSA